MDGTLLTVVAAVAVITILVVLLYLRRDTPPAGPLGIPGDEPVPEGDELIRPPLNPDGVPVPPEVRAAGKLPDDQPPGGPHIAR